MHQLMTFGIGCEATLVECYVQYVILIGAVCQFERTLLSGEYFKPGFSITD